MRTHSSSVVITRVRRLAVSASAIGLCSLAGWTVRVRHDVGCTGGSTAIAPCSGTADTLFASGSGERSFQVSNNGANALTYTPSCAVTAPLASCAISPATVTVPANGVGGVAVTYTASSTGSGGTVTVALDGGGEDQVATVIAVTAVSASAP